MTDQTTSPPTPTADFLLTAYTRFRKALTNPSTTPGTPILSNANPSNNTNNDIPILPSPQALTANLLLRLPSRTDLDYLSPRGPEKTHEHILNDILPSLNRQSLSPRYFGFVTGGVLPIAEAADNIVSGVDQNVQVHFPISEGGMVHSASTYVEGAALQMVVDLLELEPKDVTGEVWKGRTFTTGATASNILGLACAREGAIARRLGGSKGEELSVADLGVLEACRRAGVRGFAVLGSMPHSSVLKAASLVGFGRESVKNVGMEGQPWRLDLEKLEEELERKQKEGIACVVVVGAGEVNTGRFGTGVLDMPKVRSLADRYGAWVHVDGAFGLFARALPKEEEFLALHAQVAGLELADSIAADGHKLLNVPYDNGIFLTRHLSILTQVFRNTNAAYLVASPSQGVDPTVAIPSPLNIGLENSRRFRALPVYAVLLSEGRQGIEAMLSRMVRLARIIAAFVRDSSHYELLPEGNDDAAALENTFMIVLFKARDKKLNEELVDRINRTGKVFVSGTMWEGRKAARIAVASWQVDVERDAAVVKEVLTAVAEGRESELSL